MISFDLTPEQEEMKRLAREFAEKELLPVADEIDERDEMPWELWKKMAQPPYRWTGIFIPEEYGGHPRGILDTCIIMEELAFVSPIGAVMIEAAGLGATAVVLGGSEEQKRKFLPRIAKGEGIACFSLTEPGAGSDASSIATRAEKIGNKYVLNGRKRYASFASVADFTIVFARTEKGISAFIVEKDTPGFSVIEKVPCIGLKGHHDEEVLLKNCEILEENLIGEEGKGLRYGLGTLDKTRITLASGFIGLARAAFEASIKYAKERKTFGRPLSEHQSIRFSLADIATEIDAARLLTYRAAWLADKGLPHTGETAMAKAFASQLLLKATNVAIDVHGGFGCTKRYPVERYFRDGRIWVFAQGAPNIQRLIVARKVFGER
ncbi:MAG: acyl-CoA dehydrogenase family protein [Candidatus Syntropharchaeia archaeon]